MSQSFETIKNLERIYLDYNATTPISKSVASQLSEWASEWGNPSSVHFAGRGPKQILRNARNNISKLIGSNALELIFTSGGTEANNLAILGALKNSKKSNPDKTQIICSNVEHPSVLQTVESLKSEGYQIDYVPVLPSGELDMEIYESLLSKETALVSIMLANNETGALFPVKKMAKKAHAVGALFHTDAVQGLGKIPLNVKDLDVDFASFSAHKFYALKGCGVLYIKTGVDIEPSQYGGAQERRRRAGTENTLSIASFGEVAKNKDEILEMRQVMSDLRDDLEDLVTKKIQGIEVVAKNTKRLPNTSNLYISGVDAQTLLMNLDIQNVCVSTGSACSAGSTEPSYILLAMGMSAEKAKQCLRLSIGWSTTKDEVERFVDILKNNIERLRGF